MKLGLRSDSGNSDRMDYHLALEAERALSGWGFEGSAEYAYSEVDGAVGRDEVLVKARLDREAGEQWTLYADTAFEQDDLSGYDWTAFLGAGVGYRVYDRPGRAWTLRAGPGLRLIDEPAALTTEAALDLASDFELQLSEAVRFGSETRFLLSDSARADQVFVLDTALGELWALSLKYRYRHEFEPEPGFEEGDSRTDISVVREF
ncbi:MAG: DUF481 domain-containing protein [Oceanicaulis sp.]